MPSSVYFFIREDQSINQASTFVKESGSPTHFKELCCVPLCVTSDKLTSSYLLILFFAKTTKRQQCLTYDSRAMLNQFHISAGSNQS